MSPGQVSRRRALRILGVAGGAGIASGVAFSPAAADDPRSPSQAGDTVTSLPVFGIVGVITDIGADRFILRVGRRSLVVIPADRASIYSGRSGKVKTSPR